MNVESEIQKHLKERRYLSAFELIVDGFQNKVFRLACGMLRDPVLAEDTAQEVFLKVWRALPGYAGRASLSTWIYAITRNALIDAMKKTCFEKRSRLIRMNSGVSRRT
jgi:RNA polymerase sigma-70 factor (ECF subfamily)